MIECEPCASNLYEYLDIMIYKMKKKCHMINLLIFGDILKKEKANMWAFENDDKRSKKSLEIFSRFCLCKRKKFFHF